MKAATPDLRARAIDELYGTPPERFTERRDALAKELKEAGDVEGANDLRAQRRPTKVAHLLNQVARRAPDEVAALVDLGRELARVQRRAIRGQADGGELREAIARQREMVSALVKRAAEVGDEIEIDARPLLDEVASALRTAMTDPGFGAELEEGRLAKAPEIAVGLPSGELLASVTPIAPAAKRVPAKRAREEQARAREDEARREAKARRREKLDAEARARDEAEAREREKAEAAARARAEAEAHARDAADEAGRLRAEATRAEEDARALAEAAERAAAAAKDAAREAQRLVRQAGAAERRAAEARRRIPHARPSKRATRHVRTAVSKRPAARARAHARSSNARRAHARS